MPYHKISMIAQRSPKRSIKFHEIGCECAFHHASSEKCKSQVRCLPRACQICAPFFTENLTIIARCVNWWHVMIPMRPVTLLLLVLRRWSLHTTYTHSSWWFGLLLLQRWRRRGENCLFGFTAIIVNYSWPHRRRGSSYVACGIWWIFRSLKWIIRARSMIDDRPARGVAGYGPGLK